MPALSKQVGRPNSRHKRKDIARHKIVPVAGRSAGAEASRHAADEFAKSLLPVIGEIQAKGISTLDGIAGELTTRGIATKRSGAWHRSTVKRLLERLERLKAETMGKTA